MIWWVKMHVFNVLGKFTHKNNVPPSCYLLLLLHLLKAGLLVLGFPTTGFLSFLQHLGEHVLKLLNKLLLLTLRSAFVPFLTDWFLQKSCMPHRQEATESGYHPPANGIEKATHYTLHRRGKHIFQPSPVRLFFCKMLSVVVGMWPATVRCYPDHQELLQDIQRLSCIFCGYLFICRVPSGKLT